MRALLQRVKWAHVRVGNELVGLIDQGLCVFLGVGQQDTTTDADWLAEKIAHLRIFADSEGRMNRSLLEQGGSVLAISQFTLFADCRKGRRPNFTQAAGGEAAQALYEHFVKALDRLGVSVATGRFGADMAVSLENDGPVTIWLDTELLRPTQTVMAAKRHG